jgi:hypothetical protein
MSNVRSMTCSTTGSVSEWSRAGIEQARVRLEMEREERLRLASLTERVGKRQHAYLLEDEESGSIYSADREESNNEDHHVGEGVIVEGRDEEGKEKMDGVHRVDKGKGRAVDA